MIKMQISPNYVEVLNLFLFLYSEPSVQLTMCAGVWMQFPIIQFNDCIADVILLNIYIKMFLEGRKMKKFKMTWSTNWPKERNQAKQRYIRLQKDRMDHYSSDKFMAGKTMNRKK